MKRHWVLAAVSGLVMLSACQSSGPVVYTGEEESALEGSYIKDPEAAAATRNRANKTDTTRTESNRVDIPVLEFAQMRVETYPAAMKSTRGFDARYTRYGFAASRLVENYSRRIAIENVNAMAGVENLVADTNQTLYPGLRGLEQLNLRTGEERLRAYSANERPWLEEGKTGAEAVLSRERLSAMQSAEYLEAVKSRGGYDAAFSQRVIGLHLWKYADREIVADAVEITYTIVYYNTNDFDTGPTEIDEPVPYYTEYLENTATLPKQGTTVEFLKRDTARNILRWKFPQGIKAGETNKMTYKVRVRLEDPYGPKDDTPGITRNQ